MAQKNLAKWLKFIIAGVAVCAFFVYAAIIPICGSGFIANAPELSGWFFPWLFFLWGTGIPIFIALGFGWKVAANIEEDRSFTADNAKILKWISWLAAADSGYIFMGNVVLLFLNMNHPSTFLMLLIVVFLGVAVTVAAAALSHLALKASDLQEQSDLTI